MSSLVKDAVISIINKNLEEHGIVIWYDSDKVYKGIINETNFKNVPIIIFNGSYFDVRFKAEKFFDGLERNNLLIYIDKDRDTKNYPLIELEEAGCICSPTSLLKHNTDFAVVVKKALKGSVKPELLEEICKKIGEKRINLDEIEKLIKDEEGKTILPTIFDASDPKEIILMFLCRDELDTKIENKNSFGELKSFLERYLNINLNNINRLEELRKKISEVVLLSDFLISTNSIKIAEKYKTLKLPADEDAKVAIKDIVKKWRDEPAFYDKYISVAEMVQNKYKISDEISEIEEIIGCETFKVIDEKILKNLFKKIKEANLEKISELISKRKKTCWVKNTPEYNLIYQILEYYIKLKSLIEDASKIISSEKLSLDGFISLYVGKNGNNGWFLIDRYFRLMETKFTQLDIGGSFDNEMDCLMPNVRNLYSNFLNKQIREFILRFRKNTSLDELKILLQKDIYRKKVLPLIEEGRKCVYLLVDALRYEMGEELFDLLDYSKERNISAAIATIPTVTKFGMMSLILNPDDCIKIESDESTIYLKAGGTKIKNRSDRLKYLKGKNSFCEEIFKLDQIVKPKKSVRDKLKSSNFIIVTSQEIDSIMEEGNDTLAKDLMDNIFIQIKRAINTLSELGFEKFILSADHGYLLGSGIGKEHKVDVPNGKTFDLHKRYWMGKGGDSPENTIRFKASDFGYSNDLEFVFPIGISIFKTPGQENDYFHGGISLQELIIPVIEFSKVPAREKKAPVDMEYKIVFNKDIVTNRIFLIKVSAEEKQLTIESEKIDRKKKVSLKVVSEDKIVGQAVAAEYGFIDSTNEIMLELNKSNAITVMLKDDFSKGKIDLILIDAETELELSKIGKLEVKLTI